jgi:hypothetical protein
VFLNKYYTDDQINEKMGGACENVWETANAYRVLIGKSEGNIAWNTHA